VDVQCQGSIVRYTRTDRGAEKDRLLFANPDSSYGDRINMTVKLSCDEGQTWPVAKTVHPGPSAYCCLAPLEDGSIGLLYEGGKQSPYEEIRFSRFSLQWLIEGADKSGD
jgi:Neuraminidase (sialidase)